MLFAVDKRPSAADIDRLLSSPEMAGAAARISYRPPEEEGWAEILATGLTFDLVGLAPAAPADPPPVHHRFGLAPDLCIERLEAITLLPGQHIATRLAMLPVVRAMVSLAANMALPLSAEAVCWQPAGTAMEPQYFSRVMFNWLAGGAFPALGLTAVEKKEDGSVTSVGLSHFVGQELQLEAAADEAPADTVKLAVRLIDHLVRRGRLERTRELKGPSGERLLAEPSQSRDLVWVWRSH